VPYLGRDLISKLVHFLHCEILSTGKIKEANLILEKTVLERTHELADAVIEKDRILGVVVHDLKNKIGGSYSLLKLINGKEYPLDEDEKFQ